MKVSFDFDGTLSKKEVQNYARSLFDSGFEVWIVTSRFDDDTAMQKNWHWIKGQNEKLFDVAEQCGISKDNIYFTCTESKSLFLKGKSFIFHIDDDVDELMAILNSKDSCKTVNVEHFEWKETCENILKKYL